MAVTELASEVGEEEKDIELVAGKYSSCCRSTAAVDEDLREHHYSIKGPDCWDNACCTTTVATAELTVSINP